MNARHILTAAALGLGLTVSGGVASAQYETAPVMATNSSGDCYTTGGPGNWTISCGDINYAPGRAVVVAPTVDTADAAGVSGTTTRTPATVSSEPLPEPAPTSTETLATDSPSDTTSSTGTVATETDRDADNYADALEAEAGLDPTNPTPTMMAWPMAMSSRSIAPIPRSGIAMATPSLTARNCSAS
jgi:hypothetical protein